MLFWMEYFVFQPAVDHAFVVRQDTGRAIVESGRGDLGDEPGVDEAEAFSRASRR